jgi:uncharacterized protein (DUF2384 family)
VRRESEHVTKRKKGASLAPTKKAEEGPPRVGRVAGKAKPEPVRVLSAATRGGDFVSSFFKEKGVAVEAVAKSFGMSKGQLAQTVGVKPATLHRAKREAGPKAQARVKEMLEIVGRIAGWAGGKEQAMAWYRAEPIPAFGDRTAESLVKEGKASAVRDYLDFVALGGFA